MKVALGIEYDGYGYKGWQRQALIPTVQFILEQAISYVANHEVITFCAGRTDAGVHSTGQVIHFETHSTRKISSWIYGVNRYLPSNIKVIWAKEVPDDFHARFSAINREYRYIILNSSIPSALLNNKVSIINQDLDANLMHIAAQNLLGEHDFTSFRAANCQSLTPNRNVISINIFREGKFVICTIKANAFLYHMVRNIIGSLIKVGTKEKEPTWIKWLLEQKNRSLAAPTAPAAGLYLTKVTYQEKYNIPTAEPISIFM